MYQLHQATKHRLHQHTPSKPLLHLLEDTRSMKFLYRPIIYQKDQFTNPLKHLSTKPQLNRPTKLLKHQLTNPQQHQSIKHQRYQPIKPLLHRHIKLLLHQNTKLLQHQFTKRHNQFTLNTNQPPLLLEDTPDMKSRYQLTIFLKDQLTSPLKLQPIKPYLHQRILPLIRNTENIFFKTISSCLLACISFFVISSVRRE